MKNQDFQHRSESQLITAMKMEMCRISLVRIVNLPIGLMEVIHTIGLMGDLHRSETQLIEVMEMKMRRLLSHLVPSVEHFVLSESFPRRKPARSNPALLVHNPARSTTHRIGSSCG
jgi:hypothetical protein